MLIHIPPGGTMKSAEGSITTTTLRHTQIHAMWLDCDIVHSFHFGHVGPQALHDHFFTTIRKE